MQFFNKYVNTTRVNYATYTTPSPYMTYDIEWIFILYDNDFMYDMTITLIQDLLPPARLAGSEAPVAVAIL